MQLLIELQSSGCHVRPLGRLFDQPERKSLMGVRHTRMETTTVPKYQAKGYNIPTSLEKKEEPLKAKSITRQPPLWRRAAGIGKSAVWVPEIGQYVITRKGGRKS